MSLISLGWRDVAPIPAYPDLQVWTSLTEAEAGALRELATGRRVLEIGAAFGFSTLLLASVAEVVWSIDPHNVPPVTGLFGLDEPAMARYAAGTRAVLTASLASARLQHRVAVCEGYSQELLAEGARLARDLQGQVNFAFIDGDHQYDACRDDLENCERLLARPAIVAVHDYGEGNNPLVRPAVDDWRGQREMRLIDTLAVLEL